MPPLETVNHLLGLATLALQVVTAALLVVYLLRARIAACGEIAHFVRKWSLPAALFFTLAASALTLIHQYAFGLPPCPLCWWQRVFLYSQAVIFSRALAVCDRAIARYSIALSTVGLGFALYHHVLQMAPAGTIPCPADVSVSCAQILFLEFGYITYPMMAATIFAFLIILMLFARDASRENSQCAL